MRQHCSGLMRLMVIKEAFTAWVSSIACLSRVCHCLSVCCHWCVFRVTFGVHPDAHIDEMQKAELVMLDSSWSAKIAITGMYSSLLCLVSRTTPVLSSVTQSGPNANPIHNCSNAAIHCPKHSYLRSGPDR